MTHQMPQEMINNWVDGLFGFLILIVAVLVLLKIVESIETRLFGSNKNEQITTVVENKGVTK